MSPWVPVAIAACGTLAVLVSQRHSAYLARQQQLRIEKHREDPSFPLEAPPSKLRLFFRTYSADVLGISMNGSVLVFLLTRSGPVSRIEVFNVAFIVASTIWILSSNSQARVRRRDLETSDKMMDVSQLINERLTLIADNVAELNREKDKHRQ